MKEIRRDLRSYVTSTIIPEYNNFDKAHGFDHVVQVIEKSLFLAERTDADKEMVYVIAAYHDVGMRIARERHCFYSAQILLNDSCLPIWFSSVQLKNMAEAVEDHSTSLEREPRSLYGKIIYQADKMLDANIVIKRAILFGMAQFKDYGFEQQAERVFRYINNKYGEQGQIKLWIDIPEETARLQLLQIKIKDKDYVYDECLKYYNQEHLGEIKRSYRKGNEIKRGIPENI